MINENKAICALGHEHKLLSLLGLNAPRLLGHWFWTWSQLLIGFTGWPMKQYVYYKYNTNL